MGRDRIYLYNMVDGRVKILAEGNDTIQPRSIAYDGNSILVYSEDFVITIINFCDLEIMAEGDEH